MIKHFERNIVGSDFVAGDLHGFFHLLEEAMFEVNFNPAVDRLFTPGDLINKGPFSEQVVHYLNESWFHASLGNHEECVLLNYTGQYSDAELAKSSGLWYVNLPRSRKEIIAEALQQLPLGMEVETNFGLVGLVHAEVMRDDWHYFKQCAMEIKSKRDFARVAAAALWDKERIRTHRQNLVRGVAHVYVGHAPQTEIKTLGNVSYIDAGLYKGGKLELIPITHFARFSKGI
jgi:serine/threonine protein phosphatase 1